MKPFILDCSSKYDGWESKMTPGELNKLENIKRNFSIYIINANVPELRNFVTCFY